MNINLKMFCILCLILCDTSSRTNYNRFILNCDVPEEISVTFDPEVDLMTMPLVDHATSGFILLLTCVEVLTSASRV